MTPQDVERLARVRGLALSGEARRIRTEARVSLADIGKACGVAESTVYRWESGLRAPRGRPAIRYLKLLDRLAAQSNSTVGGVAS